MALVDYGSDQASGGSDSDSTQESQDSLLEQSDSDSQGPKQRHESSPAGRLQDHGADVTGPGSSGLPSALSALEALEGPPSYLTPEATRPLASSAYHGRLVQAAAKASSEDATGKRDRKTGYAPGEWDITKMAPKLKGQAPPAPAGVVSAAAVRYKTDDRVGSNIVTAAQVAMLGGQWASSADATEEGSKRQGPQPAPQTDPNPKRKSTSAMGVQDFLDKGHGGAQLPRKKQDRKDMEKSKRERGQSSHAAWKSEAEMVLRQQYD